MLLVHITAAYTNAVLVAILPHVSDFSKQLDLPIPTPIVASQVDHFNVIPWKGDVGGGIRLTNHYLFGFGNGYVSSFHSPTNWFDNTNDNWGDLEYYKRYLGKDNMTTNDAVELARTTFRKIGYKSEDFQIDGPPAKLEGPFNVERIGGHIPFYRTEWDSPESRIRSLLGLNFNIQFDIDMQHGQIAGMNLSGRVFWRPNPKVGVTPVLETDYSRAGKAGQFAQMLNREPAVRITPAYSNATLTATLPYIADFAKKLNLPISQPLIGDQVLVYLPPLYYTNDGLHCTVMLTNHFWFSFVAGYVYEFGSPDDWFEEKAIRANWDRCGSEDCMTTNEAVDLARNCLRKLGYKPEDFQMNVPPTTFENAVDSEQRQYAYCRITWENAEEDTEGQCRLEFDIDMQRKQITGMSLLSSKFYRHLPKIDVVPELESDDLKHSGGKMFVRTNAPQYWQPQQKLSDGLN